jgi:hypothetical protein
MTDKIIKRILDLVTNINKKQISIEDVADSDCNFKMFGYKDNDGIAQKLLAKNQDAVVKALQTKPDLTIGEALQLYDATGNYGFAVAEALGIAYAIMKGQELQFQDQHLAAPIPLSEAGETGLDGAFTAVSLVGALNELVNLPADAVSIWTYLLEQPKATRDKWGANVIDHQASSYTPGNGATITDTDTGIVRITSDGATAISYGSIVAYGVGTDNVVIGAMRGDGATGQPRAISGSTIIKLGTTSTGWQYFALAFTSTVTTLLIQNMSATGYTEFKWVQSLPVRASVPVSGERYEYQRVENLFPDSEDYTSGWGLTRMSIESNSGKLSPLIDHDTKLPVEYMGLINDASTSTHTMQRDLNTDGSNYSFRGFFANGFEDWYRLLNLTNGEYAYVDVGNGVKGTLSANAKISIVQHGDAGNEVLIELPTTAATNTFVFYSTSADGVLTATGDGVTISTYATGMQAYKGTIADNFPYVKTTTAAISGVQKFNLEDKTIQEQRDLLGLRERIVNDAPSGIIETPTPAYKYVDCFPKWNPEIPPANPSAFDEEFMIAAADSTEFGTKYPAWSIADPLTLVTAVDVDGLSVNVTIDSTASMGYNHTPRLKTAVPDAGTTWSIIAQVSHQAIGGTKTATLKNRYMGVGLLIGSTVDAVSIGPTYRCDSNYQSGSAVSHSSMQATQYTLGGDIMAIPQGIKVWLRIDKLTTSAYTVSQDFNMYASLDGENWIFLTTITYGWTTTPDEIFFGMIPPKSSDFGMPDQAICRVHSYRVFPDGLASNDKVPGKLIYNSTIKD